MTRPPQFWPQLPAQGPRPRAWASLLVVVCWLACWVTEGHAAPAGVTKPGGERADSQALLSGSAFTVRGSPSALRPGGTEPFEFLFGGPSSARFRYWWNGLPSTFAGRSLPFSGRSNIRQSDYAGPEACKECHAANYQKWTGHAHRWMNAPATAETVKGDFTGRFVMHYQGGEARFYRENGTNFMRLERDATVRVYAVARTIGSRYFQYYAGRLVAGPEPADHPVRAIDHVLPLGYLLDQKEWMPIIHIDEEKPDGQRADAFAGPSDIPYDASCSVCHTTWPAGDWLMTYSGMTRANYFSPFTAEFNATGYLSETHPQILKDVVASGEPADALLTAAFRRVVQLPVAEHAVALGITCEACHNGAKSHAESSTRDKSGLSPLFFPSSSNLVSHGPNRTAVWTRRPQNVNWTCARCHSGGRPSYAAGMGVWNSIEFADAVSGSCYLKDPLEKRSMPGLTCVHCHNPHQGIGPRWTRTPDEDDAKCLDCHKKFVDKPARLTHTHHPENTPGDRCMNCHMPKITESLQDVVRTHMIFNPTDARMIEANQPNACNVCHLKESIDWTLGHLRTWYPKAAGAYAEDKLKANYPNRPGPVGLGWLKSPHESTRLVAADALARANARWALPDLIAMLDDPYLINRRFTQVRLGEMLGTDLRRFGYRFYQTPSERRDPLQAIRAQLLSP